MSEPQMNLIDEILVMLCSGCGSSACFESESAIELANHLESIGAIVLTREMLTDVFKQDLHELYCEGVDETLADLLFGKGGEVSE